MCSFHCQPMWVPLCLQKDAEMPEKCPGLVPLCQAATSALVPQCSPSNRAYRGHLAWHPALVRPSPAAIFLFLLLSLLLPPVFSCHSISGKLKKFLSAHGLQEMACQYSAPLLFPTHKNLLCHAGIMQKKKRDFLQWDKARMEGVLKQSCFRE